MQGLDIIPGRSQMPQVTSRQGSSPMMLGSDKPHADNDIVSLMADAMSDSSHLEISKQVQPVIL